MTLTIDITPELETRLQKVATRRGQSPGVYAWALLQLVLGLRPAEDEAEAAFVAQWSAAFRRTLHELLDNDEDAVYDTIDGSRP